MTRKDRKLVRESEWVRIYRTKNNVLEVVSKFLEGNLQPTAAEFEKKWPVLSPEGRLDVCSAYQAKARLSEEDVEILNVIMMMGDELSWGNIVSVFARHPDRNRVIAFIRERLEKQSPPLANFYQAIETLEAKELIPKLLEKHKQYRRSGVSPKSQDRILCIDYLVCCKTVWKLTGIQDYKAELQEYLTSDDKVTRDFASRLLLQS